MERETLTERESELLALFERVTNKGAFLCEAIRLATEILAKKEDSNDGKKICQSKNH